MKKGLCFLLCGLILIAAAGCSGPRVYTQTKERVDIDVTGNQGVVYGPTPAPHKVAVTDREIVAVDIELPTMGEVKEAAKKTPPPPTQDKAATGNAGVILQKIK